MTAAPDTGRDGRAQIWARRGAIAAGGALGAAARWGALAALPPTGSIPWAVLAVNVAGSLVLGALLAAEWDHPRARLLLHDLGAIGFCGGLTTFSTFSVDVAELLDDGRPAAAAAHVALSVSLSVAAVVAGAAALRRVRATTLPLEEAP